MLLCRSIPILGNSTPLPAPPAGGDPYWSSVKLLMGFEGSDGSTGSPGMNDESSAAHGTATVGGNAQIDTAQFKFGSSSLLCDGSGDGLSYANSTDWDLSSANSDQFTVEAWIRPNATNISNKVIVGKSSGVGNISFFFWLASSGNGELAFWGSTNNTSFNWSVSPQSSGLTWTSGQWYHVAADKDSSGKVRVYRDGTMVASGTPSNSALAGNSALLTVGSEQSAFGRSFNGWIDEVRITKGVARYASDSGYTVPIAAYPRN